MKKTTLLALVFLSCQSYTAHAITDDPLVDALNLTLSEVEPSNAPSETPEDLDVAFMQSDSDDNSELSDFSDEDDLKKHFKIWKRLNDSVGGLSDHLNDSVETADFLDETLKNPAKLDALDTPFILSDVDTASQTAASDENTNALDTTFIQSEVDESPLPNVKSKWSPISWLKKKLGSLKNSSDDTANGANDFVDYSYMYEYR